MSQDENNGILGISLVDDQLRIVEGHRGTGDDFRITRIAQGRSREPFSFKVVADKNMPRLFGEDITRLYQSQDFQVKRVAFSLDSDMVLVKRLDVDRDVADEHLQGHVQWEVEQFAISPTQKYIIDYEQLEAESTEELQKLLVVVVRKQVVRFLRHLFKNTDLQLSVVDVDVFSAHRALQVNYDYGTDENVSLVQVEDGRIRFAILRGRNFYLAQDVAAPAGTGAPDASAATVRLVAKELRRIVLDHQLGKRVEDLSEIFLYGEGVDDQVLEGLQNNYDVQIDRANPFRKIKLVEQAKEEAGEIRPERYLISVGAALRGIQ